MKLTVDTHKTLGVIINGQDILTKLVERYTITEIGSIYDTQQENCLTIGESLITNDPQTLCNIEGLDYIELIKNIYYHEC